jgi:myo-inositol-1(or 4)-monophosphatase
MTSKLPAELEHLQAIARRAGEIAVKERHHLVRELKPDGSIVTNGDRAVETWLRYELPMLVPGTTIWGEEFGCEPEGPEGIWLLDPVDGTTNYAFGSPLWGVSIALVKGNEVLFGAIEHPDLCETYISGLGIGAYVNGRRLNSLPSGPIRPEEITSYADSILLRYGKPNLPGKMRSVGSFVVDGTFVASGRYRGMIAGGEHLYDAAAAISINQELGADIRYADGRPFDIDQLSQGQVIEDTWLIFPPESGFYLDQHDQD